MIFCCCKFCVNLAPLTVNFRACQHEIFYNILIAHNVKQAQYTILLFVLQYSAVCVCLPLAFSLFSFYLSLSFSLLPAPVSRHRWMITRYIVNTSSKGGGRGGGPGPPTEQFLAKLSFYPSLLNSERILLVAKCGSFKIARIRTFLFFSSSENWKFQNKKLGFESTFDPDPDPNAILFVSRTLLLRDSILFYAPMLFRGEGGYIKNSYINNLKISVHTHTGFPGTVPICTVDEN